MSVSALTGFVKVGVAYTRYITVTSTLGANEYDNVIALLSGAATLNLPALADCPNNYTLFVRNNSAAPQTLTLQGSGAELIGASNTASVTQNQGLRITVDHVRSKWQILFGPA